MATISIKRTYRTTPCLFPVVTTSAIEAPAQPNQDRSAIITSTTRYYQLLSKTVSIKLTDIAYPPLRYGDQCLDSKTPIEMPSRLGFFKRTIGSVRHVAFVCNNNIRPVCPYTQRSFHTIMRNLMHVAERGLPARRSFSTFSCGRWITRRFQRGISSAVYGMQETHLHCQRSG